MRRNHSEVVRNRIKKKDRIAKQINIICFAIFIKKISYVEGCLEEEKKNCYNKKDQAKIY